MAVPGKFETTRKIFCALCRKLQIVIARSKDWTGDLRTDLVCTTPGCKNVFEDQRTKNRATKVTSEAVHKFLSSPFRAGTRSFLKSMNAAKPRPSISAPCSVTSCSG